MSHLSRKAIGRMNVEPVDQSRSYAISQPFQCRTNELGTRVPVITEGILFSEPQFVLCDAQANGLALRIDRLVVGLFLRTDARV